MRLDPAGNLYVTDNGGEAGSNMRVLEFDSTLFPATLGSVQYGTPATRVFGTGGSFTIKGQNSTEPRINPFKVGFHSQGHMVVPSNAYTISQCFPMVYLDPLDERLPQMALGDYMVYPNGGAFFDSDDNLYIGDYDWSRFLVYMDPFKYLYESTPTATSTPTITPSPTMTPTPTLTPTPTQTPTSSPSTTPTPTTTGSTPTMTATPTTTPAIIPDLALLVSQNEGDLNIYFWNSLARGDWMYWDCYARNPSPLARDFWQIPTGNDAVGMTSIDISEPMDSKDDLALLVRQNLGDLNIYFWNTPVPGVWRYWDCYARNPSPLARDFWQISTGNDAVGMSRIALE